MVEQKQVRVVIPEGCFEGNCDSCFYAKKKNRDSEGRLLCKGEPGGYRFSYEENGCKYYISKVKQWIKIAVVLFFCGAGVELLLTILMH